GAPERGQELRRVEEEAEHPLFALDAQVEEGVAGPVHQLLEACVSERPVVVVKRYLGAPPLLHVAVDEKARGVEALGNLDAGRGSHGGFLHDDLRRFQESRTYAKSIGRPLIPRGGGAIQPANFPGSTTGCMRLWTKA